MEREHRALTDLSELALFILDYVKQHGRVTNRDIVREQWASPNTVKALLSSLVEKKLLDRQGAGRSTRYIHPDGV